MSNAGLKADMQDNLERLNGVGASRDITEMDSYDPHDRVGTENDFSRDFGSDGATRSTKEAGSATEHILNRFPAVAMVPKAEPADKKHVPCGAENDPAYIFNSPARRIDTGQVALNSSPTRIVFDTPERLSLIVVNRDTTNALYIGANAAVSSATGFVLDAGASITLAVSCELWALSPAGAIVNTFEFLQ